MTSNNSCFNYTFYRTNVNFTFKIKYDNNSNNNNNNNNKYHMATNKCKLKKMSQPNFQFHVYLMALAGGAENQL